MIEGVLLDLGGVVYDGDKPIAGSIAAVGRLRASGLPVRFITNTTRNAGRTLLARLRKMGLDVASEELFTPARAACSWIAGRGLEAHLLIHPALAEDFADLPPGDGPVVVVGDAGEAFTYRSLNAAFRKLADGAPLVALATNRVFKDADGGLSLDAGAFIAALEFASRQTAAILGKPSPEFFAAAVSSMGCELTNVAMVGDDTESDAAGALDAGLGFGILVRTGKYLPGDEARARRRPTAVVDDLAAAVDWILEHRG